MSASDKYYWLKLKEDFFSSKRIKKLRKLAGGDTYVIIYLKMQLIAMKHDGIIQYTGLEKTFAEELALDIDEDPENVSVTLAYLLSRGLAESSDDINYFFPYAVENVGSETSAAQRMREARKKTMLKAPENTANIVKHCSNNVEQCSNNVRTSYTDIEIELEKDIEIEKEYKSPSSTRVRAREESTSDDPALGVVVTAYTERLGRLPSSLIIEEMKTYLHDKGLEPDVITRAIDIACGEGIYKWSYIKGVMNRYVDAGAKTLAAAMIEDEKHRPRKSTRTESKVDEPEDEEHLREVSAALAAELGIDLDG